MIVPLLVLFKEFGGFVQMRELLFEQGFPDPFDAGVGLVEGAAIVEIALRVLVFDEPREPSAVRVHQTAVLRDVLFLYHGLLFCGGDDGGIEAGDRVGALEIAGAAHVVGRVAVFRDCGTSRGDLRALADKA